MRRIFYTFLSVLVIILVIAIAIFSKEERQTQNPRASTSGETGKVQTQKIAVSEVTHSVFYAPQYVAMNLGFFEEEGLELELINGGGADNVMTAVLSNQVEIGFAGPEATIYVYNEGLEDYAEVFAQVTKKDGSMLVGRENDENFDWKKLKGKHILPGRTGGVPYMTFEYVLKKYGLNPQTDLNLDTSISFDAMTSAFVSGTGDYVTVFEPTASTLEKNGQGYIVDAVGANTDEIPYTAYFAKKSYIENHSDIIEHFTRAIYKGLLWVESHTPEEIAEAVAPSFPDSDIALLASAIQHYKEIDVWKTQPAMTEASFNLLQNVIQEAGELEKSAPFDKLVNNIFAQKVLDEN
ncbi:MAG: ABC transporter substrate-binding protein [Clostridia bacterium]|nr:ABC transporter substrate-binding protein [Clostridia bacterium]